MDNKPAKEVKELYLRLVDKFGPNYVPHKLSEECSELAVAIHKILAINLGFAPADVLEKQMRKVELCEEIAHVKVFIRLLEESFEVDRQLIGIHISDRYNRLELKTDGKNK